MYIYTYKHIYTQHYISYNANTIGKGMNQTILYLAMSKIIGQTGLLSLDIATSLEGKLWIQTC